MKRIHNMLEMQLSINSQAGVVAPAWMARITKEGGIGSCKQSMMSEKTGQISSRQHECTVHKTQRKSWA